MTPEGRVKEKVKAILKAMDVWYYMPVPGGFGASAVADFFCCFKGKFIAIECKAGKNPLTPLQRHTAKILEDHGALTLTINEENLWVLEKELTKVFLENSFRQ